MLEPTKEPVKPISAAEMIASIAQMPAVAPEMSSTTADPGQVEPTAQGPHDSALTGHYYHGIDPLLVMHRLHLVQSETDIFF